MRMSKPIGSMIAIAAAVVAMTTSAPSADDSNLLRVSCQAGNVTVSAVSSWTVNDKAPWKWDKGSMVSVNSAAAKFKGAKCEGNIRAFICKDGACKGPIAIPVR